ncbi:MAG: hypothetical protein HN413_01085 [Chloroflexi bacterium]|jgi:hypothetical protein|nr:hypothetical protein [Chloroflexota bacterium]
MKKPGIADARIEFRWRLAQMRRRVRRAYLKRFDPETLARELATEQAIQAAYDEMFRDSRKYFIDKSLRSVLINQSPSLTPAEVRALCSSVFLGSLTEPDDKVKN